MQKQIGPLLKCLYLMGSIGIASRSLALEFRFEMIPITLKSGRILPAQLMIPTGAPKSRHYPLLTLFGGFENAARVLNLVRPRVPLAMASFDYPYDPPRGKFEFPSSLKHLPEAKRTVHETFEGIELLYAALRVRPDIDPQRMGIIGASLGAPFAVLSAAAISDIKKIILVHGFADLPRIIGHQLMRRWKTRWLEPFAWTLGHVGAASR